MAILFIMGRYEFALHEPLLRIGEISSPLDHLRPAGVNMDGSLFVYFRKTVAKYWLEEKPSRKATSVTECRPPESNFDACSIRLRMTYSPGDIPVD